MYTLNRANAYINDNKAKVNQQYRLKYHLMPDVGWMNDPNGLIYYEGKYHVFFQYYPYGTNWGPMHWGHAVSDDLVRFENVNVALAPENDDETGIWSGGAEIDRSTGEMVLFYTKHFEENHKIQTQNLAVSKDGFNFVKKKGTAIGIETLPKHASREDFRDANPVYINGNYYVIIGSKNDSDNGQFLIYRSEDLKTFSYHGTFGPSDYFGRMAECPDLFKIGDKDVLLMSAIDLKSEEKRFKNCNSCIYMIGTIDVENLIFNIEHVDEIDKGHDFYAPQTMLDDQGRRIMLAWMEMWKKDYFLDLNNHGWNGAMTFPRVLMIKEDRLVQYPVDEIKQFRANMQCLKDGIIISKVSDLELKLGESFNCIRFWNSGRNEFFEIGSHEGSIYFSSDHLKNHPQQKRTTSNSYKIIHLRILLDTSSVEIFIDMGAEAITSRIYMDTDSYYLEINGEVLEGTAYEIVV